MAKCPNMVNHRNLPFPYMAQFHNSFIKPSLTSGLSALPLSNRDTAKLIKFEKSLIRHMFGLRKNSPISQLFLFLGIEPIEISLKRDTLSLFHNSWWNSDNPVTKINKFLLKNKIHGNYWIWHVDKILKQIHFPSALNLL